MNNIRNFCIIAHVDHGKSTLADRLLEITGTVEKRLMKPQYLDQLELERERGITIKMAPVRMNYELRMMNNGSGVIKGRNSTFMIPDSLNSKYILNLIDTPGHSDFSYEVSRALAAVEGVVLLVDATQGIQAQTLANFENAKKAGLTIIGAVNKIDVASPEQIEAAVNDLSNLLEVPGNEILQVSGKTGEGVPRLLEEVIKKVPPPKVIPNYSRALVFDSLYDEHKGVIAFVRMFSGSFKTNETLYLLSNKQSFKTKEIGYFTPQLKPSGAVLEGETGYLATGIKDPDVLKIGDTVSNKPDAQQIPGYKEPTPVVFVSFYPEDTSKYDELKQALAKLRLTDAALKFEPDFSEVLGRGFKGGFLGRLHFEITAERLEREFKISTVHSFPSVEYRVRRQASGVKDWQVITNPKDFPDDYLEAEEPITKMEIVLPPQYLGAVLQLKEVFRFSDLETKTLNNKVVISAKLPLADIVRDLDDKLKSVTQGFASFSYEIAGYGKANLAKLEILVASHSVPGLTRVLPKKDIEREARHTVEKLKELLPRQQYVQAVQASSGGRIIAREDIAALRKDVTGYLYGGDRTRKMKLWKKQQKGKQRLKEMANQNKIKIPASVFKELLKKC